MILTSRPRSRPRPAAMSGRAAVGVASATGASRSYAHYEDYDIMSIHSHKDDDEPAQATDNSSESVTYVEISSVDHPTAYALLSQGGTVRSNTDTNDFYAELTEAVAPFWSDDTMQPFLDFALVNNADELDADSLCEFMERHEVMSDSALDKLRENLGVGDDSDD